MALNPDRSEAIFRRTCRQRAVHSYSNLATVNVAGCEISLADHIKILGVDKILSVDNHSSSVSKSAQYTISVHYGISVPPYLKTWLKWKPVRSLAVASTKLTLFYTALPIKYF